MVYKESRERESRQRKRKRFCRNLLILWIVSTLGGASLGIAAPMVRRFFRDSTESAAEDREKQIALTFQHVAPLLTDEEYDFGSRLSDIVTMVEPSVVSIVTTAEYASGGFFGFSYDTTEAGSGIIFNQDKEKLYIVTNYHVIDGAKSVKVTKDDLPQVPARLVGQDVETDLAVISVQKSDLRESGLQEMAIAVFGDSEALQVGETVLAIGNAFGLGNTATTGIVSAKDKEMKGENWSLTMIQTDAAINTGNSGGPLINLRGEVIGINTAKVSAQSVEGMGYSISSNEARPVIEQIMRRTHGPFLGISGRTVTEDTAAQYDLPRLGVWIETVFPGSSAEKAGVRPGDIIVSIDGENISTMEQLAETIQSFRVGDVIEIKLIRNGKTSMKRKAKLESYAEMNF